MCPQLVKYSDYSGTVWVLLQSIPNLLGLLVSAVVEAKLKPSHCSWHCWSEGCLPLCESVARARPWRDGTAVGHPQTSAPAPWHWD